MHELQTLQHLVDYILFVNVLKDVRPDNGMKVSIHKIKDQVNISIVLSSYDILETNNILMTGQFLQEDDFSEGTLGISRILKGVKVLLQSHYVLGLLINSLPNDTVSSLAYNLSGYYINAMNEQLIS